MREKDNLVATPAVIRFSAMNLLAMREHSVVELEKKLQQKFNNMTTSIGQELLSHQEPRSDEETLSCSGYITEVITRLTDDGLQSDARFTEAFVAMRQKQGKGPLIIRKELKERGISGDLIAMYVDLNDDVWNQIAKRESRKKFGEQNLQVIKQLAKQIRFLTYRGFNSANINYVLKGVVCINE